jgi:ferredoxin
MENFRVTVMPGGWGYAVGPEVSLLAGAESAGVILPSSCRNGTCRTCLCHLASGAVHYLVPWPGVSLDERRAGWILPCVAVARSDLVLDAPAARAP